jgi:hypothetical protein
MIWFDIAVILFLALRMVVFGSMQPRLFDRKNNLSSLTIDKRQEERLSVIDEEGDSLNLLKLRPSILGSPQLHIHVIPDLNDILWLHGVFSI